MKNSLFALTLTLSLYSFDALRAETNERDGPRLSLAINPVTVLFPWVELQIGIAFNPHARFNITPQYLSWAWNDSNASSFAYGGTLSATFLTEEWYGWYFEPGFLYLRNNKGAGYWVGGQVIAGYEHLWNNGAFVSLGVGVGVGHFDDGSDGDAYLEFSGTYPYPTGNLHIGMKF